MIPGLVLGLLDDEVVEILALFEEWGEMPAPPGLRQRNSRRKAASFTTH